jgi:cell division protein FtsB
MKPKKAVAKNKVSRQLAKKDREISRLKKTVVALDDSVNHLEKQLVEEQRRHASSKP